MEDSTEMENTAAESHSSVSILEVLAVWPCARAIFEHVPARDLVRSERVSKDWQHAVHDYLPSCSLDLSNKSNDIANSDHRTVLIEIDHYSSLLLKTLEKLGPFIVKVTTVYEGLYEKDINVIASRCPNIQHIELRQEFYFDLGIFEKLKWITMRYVSMNDIELCRIFQGKCFEKIHIEYNEEVKGRFLSYIDTSNLRCLYLNVCDYLNIDLLCSAADRLQNVTSLELEDDPMHVFRNIELLLNTMPKLEELSLSGYQPMHLSQELIECFSQLHNLKRLRMARNGNVDNVLLEAVARGCGKLEYLDLSGKPSMMNIASGVAALCQRPNSGGTRIYLGYIKNFTNSANLESCIRIWPVARNLMELGCVELPPHWLEEAFRASQRQTYALELRSGRNSLQGAELKIILSTETYNPVSRYMDNDN